MAYRTLQLVQVMFVFFAIYSVFQYTGNQQKIIPFLCLVAVYGLGKLQNSEDNKPSKPQINKVDKKKNIETDVVADNLNYLLKSKNHLIVTDAIQYLLHDLGLLVSKVPQNKVFSRQIQSKSDDTPVALIVLLDIAKLNTRWIEWESIAQYASEQGEGYRTLVIWSNCFEAEAGKMKFHPFPASTKKILASKNIVAMDTYTFYSLYNLCKTGRLDIQKVMDKIHNHPGGVITLKR